MRYSLFSDGGACNSNNSHFALTGAYKGLSVKFHAQNENMCLWTARIDEISNEQSTEH